MADDGSKTEKATPKRRRDERKKGHVALSKDVVAVATLMASFFMLMLFAHRLVEDTGLFMQRCIQLIQWPLGQILGDGGELSRMGILVLVKNVLPITLVTVLIAVIATFAQTKMLVAPELMKPKLDKINPIQGFKKLFSMKNVIEALKGILKIALLMLLIYSSLRDMLRDSTKYLYVDISVAADHIYVVGRGMILRIIIAFVVIAAADYLYQWWDFERGLKMSKQEIKEEYKQTEGDPKVKGKIRDIQMQRARMRMMQQVPQADVVIRNPTHFAVALRYDTGRDSAPVVLAKGQDELALRIVTIAQEHDVAVVENVPLARALYAQVELNREIPPELYSAVAEVLVYIFQLNGKLDEQF